MKLTPETPIGAHVTYICDEPYAHVRKGDVGVYAGTTDSGTFAKVDFDSGRYSMYFWRLELVGGPW